MKKRFLSYKNYIGSLYAKPIQLIEAIEFSW
jgi:hypothetical protein